MPEALNFWEWVDEAEARDACEEDGEPFAPVVIVVPEPLYEDDIPF